MSFAQEIVRRREVIRSRDVVEIGDRELASTPASTDDAPWWKRMSDTHHADRLIELHGERLRFIPAWKKWVVFKPEQQRWRVDDASVRVYELAKDVGRTLKAQIPEVDSDQLSKVGKAIERAMSASGIRSMVELARGISGVVLDHEKLDDDPWKLGVRNGVVDLRTGKLRPADPKDLMTLQCHVEYDPAVEAPRWRDAVEQWFPDAEVREYVQRLAGLTLIGEQVEHLMAIHYGDGRNGKGTFVRALQYVLGDYATVIDHTLLQKTQQNKHDAIKAKLFRKRFAVASETDKGIKLDEASVKNLTGKDRISAEWKYGDPWDFDPSHLIHLQTNYLPKIAGRDVGIWSRLKVVPWLVTFARPEQDAGLDEALRAEGAGILGWLIEGCLAYQMDGLAEPEAVKNATLKYRATEDKLAKFTKDIGLNTEARDEFIGKKEIQERLKEWAEEEGIPAPKGLTNYLTDELGVNEGWRTINRKRMRVWLCCSINGNQKEKDE
jgi:putative DNA primase/helicase